MNQDTQFACATAPRKSSRHWENGTRTWQQLCDMLSTPSDHKECGGYLMGTLRKTAETHDPVSGEKCIGYHRTKNGLISRSMICLDYDDVDEGVFARASMLLPSSLLHTTYKSTEETLRVRILIPLSREVSAEEYESLIRSVVVLLGESGFDKTCSRPVQFMYWPSTQDPRIYRFEINDGSPLDVDTFVEKSLLGVKDTYHSSRKRDPLELPGVPGAFNKVYTDFTKLISDYDLPYDPVEGVPNRWSYRDGDSIGGLHQISESLVYSHHDTDPAGDKASSAFDLVRLHKFSDMDKGLTDKTPINRHPSYDAMCSLGLENKAVLEQFNKDRYDGFDDLSDGDEPSGNGDDDDSEGERDEDVIEEEPDDSWCTQFRRTEKTMEVRDCVQNWDLIAKHDPVAKSLLYNAMALSTEVDRDLPWRQLSKGGNVFDDADRYAFKAYLERRYHFRAADVSVDQFVITTARKRFVNPVLEWLKSLEWDGVERVETCLPGVKDSKYTRLVARKSLVAAVARMFDPGCKWDHMLILCGTEGLGKSAWVEKMARGYSAPLGNIALKDTLLILQRSWILTSDEGHSMRKADADAQKEFLTRTADTFRAPYDRSTIAHKRHCVIWGTTNDETYLQRQEGNRRFLIVHCDEAMNWDTYTPEYIDQVWAEAVHLYRSGEELWLRPNEMDVARDVQAEYTEEDSLAGVLEEWLELKVPSDWDSRSVEGRETYVRNLREGLKVEAGTDRIDRTCSRQLAIEALHYRPDMVRRTDLLDITKSMRSLKNWKVLSKGRQRIGEYGPQMVMVRKGGRYDCSH